MWPTLLLPLVSGVIDLLTSNKEQVAKETGASTEVIDGVAKSLKEILTKDERQQELVWQQVALARNHDVATASDLKIIQLMRGLVRPIITFMAMCWYVYARAAEVPLLEEDYAIIGGILAFWFGFRPFEKRLK